MLRRAGERDCVRVSECVSKRGRREGRRDEPNTTGERKTNARRAGPRRTRRRGSTIAGTLPHEGEVEERRSEERAEMSKGVCGDG